MIEKGTKVTIAISDSINRATELANAFAEEHPFFAALIKGVAILAIGALFAMGLFYILNALGFTALGPAPNSFASQWMSEIALKYGNVAKGTVYAYFQCLGMRGAVSGYLCPLSFI